MWRGGGSVGIGRAWRFRLDLVRVAKGGRSLHMYELITYVYTIHSV